MKIKAIWNFAPTRLKVPKNVLVQNENLAYSLSVVSSIINNKINRRESMEKLIDSLETLEVKIKEVKQAQKVFSTYSQDRIDKIFKAAAIAANQNRILLAKMAVEETGMGVVEDKVIKNHFASEYIYNAYKDTPTCGLIEEDKTYGIKKLLNQLV